MLRRLYIGLSNFLKTQNIKMTTAEANLLEPPQLVAGMKSLDKDLFKKDVNICYLTVKDAKISKLLPILKRYLVEIYNFKPVVRNPGSTETLIYFSPKLVKTWEDLGEEDRSKLETFHIGSEHLQNQMITLNFDNYNAHSILKAVLPDDQEGLRSYTKVGHIVHVNLREHLLPFKAIIGQVLINKVPNCRSVVNKTDAIDSTYRNFKMEVLAGESDTIVEVKENRCTFEFDFAKVYWNSRLSTEHERIVKMAKAGDVFFDVFAGVGPFAVPLAKKKCLVFANDLNPESVKWMTHNSILNNVDPDSLKVFNKDGTDFILQELKENLLKYLDREVYITMNLPALAVNFLSSFVGLYRDTELADKIKPPSVIVYCFAKGEDTRKIARDLVYEGIGYDIGAKILNVFKVRTVSNFKDMMRITFKLDRDILLGENLVEFSNNTKDNEGGKRKLEEEVEEEEDDCDLNRKRCKNE